MTESLDEVFSICTVTPRLELRTGRSGWTPFAGLTKLHAGTTPSSMLGSGSLSLVVADGKRVLGPKAAKKAGLSRPTTHQPSSNDCRSVRRSPRWVRRSSSGRTGLNNWRTFREVPREAWTVEMVEHVDMTEMRFLAFGLREVDEGRDALIAKLKGRGKFPDSL